MYLLSIIPLSLLSLCYNCVGGVDREDLARPSLKLTEEEEMADKVRVKSYGDVDMVLGRRKNGKSVFNSLQFSSILFVL